MSSDTPRYNILVIYYAVTYPLRATIFEHLMSFARYSPHRVYYLNLAVRRLPAYFSQVRFDLVVFHTIYLSRWNREAFAELVRQSEPLLSLAAPTAVLPQDEFLNTDLLVDFINRFDVQTVFPVSPPSEWRNIYSGVNFDKVRFQRVLTGYLDPQVVAALQSMARTAARPIDIGYRAFAAPAWLGQYGRLKVQVAEAVSQAAARRGLKIDISTRSRDVLLGSAWHRFLLRSKYTIGTEGGASLLDRDGSIKLRTEQFLAAEPRATFSEIERACFAGLDGNLRLTALSPRHLEACATRTCQVLVEGEYNGLLQPGRHYLELKKDFSNVEEALDAVQRDQQRHEITETAYREIVAAPECGYPHFVRQVLETALGNLPPRGGPTDDAVHARACQDDRRSWRKVRLISVLARRIPERIRGSARIMAALRRLIYATR